ncbi:DJ-1/PfpI family protein [Specibacter sp. AOP5-B1-6]|uniref:DJ-1/PfpI family protein n=1 Tax=Specibacter sp. AOP5-B1-6 TaxID=3457653 RepID=UPI00402B98E8
MTNEINGKKIVFLVAPSGVEHSELIATWEAVRAAGGTPELVSTDVDPVVAVMAGVPATETFAVDLLAGDLVVNDYAALVLPGGEESADALRANAEALRLVVDFVAAGKPVAAISHGVGILVDAGVLAGKVVTSWPGLTQEIIDAGARWADQDVQFCPEQGWMLITGKTTVDLPEFVQAMVTAFI